MNRPRPCRVLLLGAVMLSVEAAHAQSNDPIRCLEANARASGRFAKQTLRDTQRCNDRNLRIGPRCVPATDLEPGLEKHEARLRRKIEAKCGGLSPLGFEALGFPGKCIDQDPGDGFTVDDLQDCMVDCHTRIMTELVAVEYGALGTGYDGPALETSLFKCQREIGRQSAKVNAKILKAVQRCRNKVLARDLPNLAPQNCAISDPKTVAKIAKARSAAAKRIRVRCDDAAAHLPRLDVCAGTCAAGVCRDGAHAGDSCATDDDCKARTAQEAAECLVETHHLRADDPALTAPVDMIDCEYATRRACGDGVVNRLEEECDRADDLACLGACGDPSGDLPCFCTTPPPGHTWVARERVVEHANADLDNGWTGRNHDAGIVEGGGYVSDLYDCDGPDGPDVICTVGPSCSLAPHDPCVFPAPPAVPLQFGDAACATLGQGACRKTRTAVGPHCHIDIKKVCDVDADCTGGVDPFGVADRCVKTLHGPPLPLSAGSASVCVLNFFSEDVVGTTNVATGSSAVRMRQDSIVHLGATIDQPCPVCGGFCSGGDRRLCDADSDCPGSSTCITEPLCSFGPFANAPCRPDPPEGGPTGLFGNPSTDCRPNAGSNISGGGLDILFAPVTTGTVGHTPSFACDDPSFQGNACVGGANARRPCTAASDCPGGSCLPQCFCPIVGRGVPMKPNDCAPACVGGANDGLSCAVGCDPPHGFCHLGDCRLNPADTDAAQEGICTIGPADGACAMTETKGCDEDEDCRFPTCQFCEARGACLGGPNDGASCAGRCTITGGSCTANGDCPGGSSDKCSALSPDCPGGTCGEECVFARRQCFVNEGPIRIGQTGIEHPAPGVAERTTVAAFCIAATTSSLINGIAGLPGPGMLTQPATVRSTFP